MSNDAKTRSNRDAHGNYIPIHKRDPETLSDDEKAMLELMAEEQASNLHTRISNPLLKAKVGGHLAGSYKPESSKAETLADKKARAAQLLAEIEAEEGNA